MKLKTLLHDLIKCDTKSDCEITGLSLDSRTAQPGHLFFATVNIYIEEAIKKGVNAIVCETLPEKKYHLPVYVLNNLSQHIGHIAAKFYQHPSQHMNIIGVTGTNGKTSCTHFIAQALKMAGKKTAVIGTIGNGLIDHLHNGTHTTPNPIELQKLLAEFKQQQVDVVAMETSSHGLEQGRVNGTEFFLGAFTNLTHDHLDYHGTMEKYARAKYRLFEQSNLKFGVINADDPQGLKWIQQLQRQLPVYAYSMHSSLTLPSQVQHVFATHVQRQSNGLIVSIITPWGEGVLRTPLIGMFNISNLLLVITVLGIMGLPLADSLQYISELKSIPGRMQTLGGEDNKPLVIIDYAHTPDALAKTLQAAREHCQGELWCVFGCGGDRDKTKRPEMGRIAEQLADQIILTDDNPRHENPLIIIDEIRQGIVQKNKVVVEHSRRRAIAHAISCAKADDVILIAGKGHEAYQMVGNEQTPFSDLLEVRMQLYT
jgi:UDP-N-acetylmuramoyl-L-alanyl-D-glutamate--2,6-diaminopimelate ligase